MPPDSWARIVVAAAADKFARNSPGLVYETSVESASLVFVSRCGGEATRFACCRVVVARGIIPGGVTKNTDLLDLDSPCNYSCST